MTTNKERVRQFRAAFDALPVSAFNAPRDTDNPSVEIVVKQVFGVSATTRPVFHVAEIGGWVSSHTVVVEPDDGSGVFAFVVKTREQSDFDSVGYSRGSRVDALSRALDKVWAAPDRVGLAVKMMGKVARVEDGGYRINFDVCGALNSEPKVWVMNHVLGLMSESAHADDVLFLTALACPAGTFERAQRLSGAVENIRANWSDGEQNADVVAAAVQRYNGVTLNGAQLERLGVPGALLPFPREQWDEIADRLVARTYEERGEYLDAGFHPKPTPKPKADVKRAAYASFPICG